MLLPLHLSTRRTGGHRCHLLGPPAVRGLVRPRLCEAAAAAVGGGGCMAAAPVIVECVQQASTVERKQCMQFEFVVLADRAPVRGCLLVGWLPFTLPVGTMYLSEVQLQS